MVFHVNWPAAAQSPALQNVCTNNDEEAEAAAAACAVQGEHFPSWSFGLIKFDLMVKRSERAISTN